MRLRGSHRPPVPGSAALRVSESPGGHGDALLQVRGGPPAVAPGLQSGGGFLDWSNERRKQNKQTKEEKNTTKHKQAGRQAGRRAGGQAGRQAGKAKQSKASNSRNIAPKGTLMYLGNQQPSGRRSHPTTNCFSVNELVKFRANKQKALYPSRAGGKNLRWKQALNPHKKKKQQQQQQQQQQHTHTHPKPPQSKTQRTLIRKHSCSYLSAGSQALPPSAHSSNNNLMFYCDTQVLFVKK